MPTLLALADAALKTTALLGGVALAARALGQAPAATRRTLWTLALAGSLAMPPLAALLPELAIGGVPLPPALGGAPAAAGAAVVETAPAEPLAATPLALAFPRMEPRMPLADARTPGPPGPRVPAAHEATRWGSRAVAAWAIGCALVLLWQLAGLWRAALLTRRATPVDEPTWRRDLAAVRRETALTRPVRLRMAPGLGRPVVWGLWRPVVLLPASAAGWSAERRRLVLLHELVHVRRADWPLRLLARLCCAVYWFHPLVWLAAHRLTVEQEMACDEEVLARGTLPSTYAGHLLAIARSRSPRMVPATALVDMARRSQMEERLMRILDPRPRRLGRLLLVPALAFLSLLVPALAAMNPWEEPTRLEGDAELGRLLDELEDVEVALDPLEIELRDLEIRIEPLVGPLEKMAETIARGENGELRGLSAELAPFEERLAEIETRLAPGLAEMEAVEREMEPALARLAALGEELAPLEALSGTVDAELAPVHQELAELGGRLGPLYEELASVSVHLAATSASGSADAAERGRLEERAAELERQMEPHNERMEELSESLRPFHERLAAAHVNAEPVQTAMAEIHAELAPIQERLAEIQGGLSPMLKEMEEIHRAMEPVHRQMEEIHRELQPELAAIERQHELMGPIETEMAEVVRRMEPIHQKMRVVLEEVEVRIVRTLEDTLATELSGVLKPGTDLTGTAREILEAGNLRIEDNRAVRLESPREDVVEILRRRLGSARTAPEAEFEAALARAAGVVAKVEIAARPAG